MKPHKLIRTLRTFEAREMQRFRAFAASPYHNKHEGVLQLVELLGELHPQLSDACCQKTALHSRLFPGRPFREKHIAPLLTYTWHLCKAFLSTEARAGTFDLGYLQQLRKRDLIHLYRKEWQKLEPQRKQASSWEAFELAREEEAFNEQVQARQRDDSLLRKERALDHFYLAQKLRDACEMSVRQTILHMDHPQLFRRAIEDEVEARTDYYRNFPQIWVYFLVLRMLNQGSPECFQHALRSLQDQEAHFSRPERQTLYNYFHNFCIRQINQGRDSWLRENLQLYQLELDRDLLLEDGFLSEWHYKNIVTTGIRLKELDWTRRFIEAYKDRLLAQVRENAYRFNMASYHYAAGDYDRVLDLLLHVEYSDLRYALGARALLLRTYYDLAEYEALESLYGSFRQFLRRKQILAQSRRQGYYNLFKLTHKAAHLRQQLDYITDQRARQELDRLQKALRREEAVFNRSWLAEKVDELEQMIA